MYFRFSCRVQALAIRTYCHYRLGSETLRASTYEDSEAVFYLGGPHEVVVKIRNAGEDELPLPKAHKHYLVCQATGRWDPSSAQIREGFEALSEGRIPNLIESLTEDQRKLLARACSELSVAAEKAAEALRWRYGILGPHSPYSSRRSEWSFDAEQWYAFPSHSLSKLQVHVELLPTTTVHVTDNVKADTEALLSGGHTEPLSHALFREAWMEHERKNPRSALVIGVAALEAGLKKQSMSRKLWVWFLCFFESVHREVAFKRPLLATPQSYLRR